MQREPGIETGGGPTAGTDPASSVLRVGPVISWKGIFAGIFVGALCYMALAALGIALGALGLERAIASGSGGVALTVGTSLWLLLITLVALFVGGFVAARSSGIIPTRIGGIEGLVVAGLFFFLIATGLGASFGAAGATFGTIGDTIGDVAQSAQVRGLLGEAVSGLELNGEPSEVAYNLTARLVRGDEEGAASYLAAQAGITRREAKQRLDQIKTQFLAAAKDIGHVAARATQYTGWALFGMILLGGAAALFGGAFGARRNIRRPLSSRDRRVAMASRGEWSIPAMQE